MPRVSVPLAAAFLPLPAFAHTGHLGTAAGHDHWVAGAAIAIAAGIAIWQVAKDRRARREADAAVETGGEDEEAEEQPS